MVSPITTRQFAKLQEHYPAATLRELASGAALVTIPEVHLPEGWSSGTTSIRFIIPLGYPGPCPDCFWSCEALTLQGNREPQNSQDKNAIPEASETGRWFSWHVIDSSKSWNPSRDDLMTYMAVILSRFREKV